MKLQYVLFILFNSFFGFAQNNIFGEIYEDNKPSKDIEIVLYDTSKNPLQSVFSNENGFFEFVTQNGTYIAEGRHLGKILFKREIIVNGNINLGSIAIETSQKLEETVVIGRKKLIERKVDRLVFNLENSIATSGGDALDALKATPGIIVTNDQIAMIGKSGMAVMINDRIIQLRGEDVVNYLKSLSSDDIQKIEVITTPPAKYDAEGNSGLINIVLKQGAHNSWSNNVRSSYIQTTYPSISFGNTFNFSKKKLNLRASLDGKVGNELGTDYIDIVYPNESWKTKNNRKKSENFYATDLLFDYTINKNAKFGINYILNNRNPNEHDNYKGNIFNTVANSKIVSKGDVQQNTSSHSINTHYYQSLDTLNRKLAVEIDYINYFSDKSREFSTKTFDVNNQEQSYFAGLNQGKQGINIYSFRIDVEHPNKWVNLSYGGKISTTKTDNKVKFFDTTNNIPIIDLNQTDNFIYTENTQALYINGEKNVSEKWTIQLGLRYEFTQTLGESKISNEDNKLNYKKLFPTFYLQYRANENNVFNINYSKRIKRPSFWELNPFRWYINEYSYAEGNPFLQPSFADNIELTHTHKSKLISSMFFQYNTNGFGQVPFNNNQELAILRKNYFDYYTLGISETYVYNKYDWWQSQNTAFALYTDSKITSSEVNIITLSSFTYNLSSNNSFTLNKKKTLSAEINLWYQAPIKVLISDQDATYSLDFGFRYFMMNRNFQLSINAFDVFKTSFSESRISSENTLYKFKEFNDNRYFKLSLAYKFGNRKVVVEEKDSSLDEKNRI